MHSRLVLKRHDDIVHDVDEVWRSLRRTMLLLRSNDKEPAGAALRFTVGIFNFVEDVDLVTAAHLWTTFAELFNIMEDFAEADRMYKEAYNAFVKKYGVGHLAVGDYFVMMSAVRAKQGKINDAINCSGKALVIRTGALGLIHDKVADCHYNLGLLYRLSGDMQSSLKHLKTCRGIKRTLFLEQSIEVALVDLSIGQTEQWMVMYDKAYFSFYNSYRTYCILCGVASEEATVVLGYLRQLRYSYGTRFTSLIELRDIVAAMDHEYSTVEQYGSDVFVQTLLCTLYQENKLVLNALEFKFSIFNIITDPKFDVTESNFLGGISQDGYSDQKLAEAAFTELVRPLSDKSLSIVFEREWRLVELEREKLKERLVEVQCLNAKKDAEALVLKKDDLAFKAATTSPSAKISIDASPSIVKPAHRTKSVHFSPDNEIREIAADASNEDLQQTKSKVGLSQQRSDGHTDGNAGTESVDVEDEDSVDPDETDENDDVCENVDNIQYHQSIQKPEKSSTDQPRDRYAKKSNFFTRAVRDASVEELPTDDEDPSAPPSPSSSPEPPFDNDAPNPVESPPLFESPPSSPVLPRGCNFRLGSRSLLILHDSDGKGVAIRPVTEQDVLSALKPKLFSFSSFIYLLRQAKKETETSAAEVGPVPARDPSKPTAPIPAPPPLPVGWPPQAPKELSDSESRQGQMSLSSLFKGIGSTSASGMKRTSVTPTLKLKQVHWDMVMLPTTEGTIWDTGSADQPDDLSVVNHSAMFPDLIADFEIAKVGALSRSSAPLTPASEKKAPKHILDPKRSQNMTIMLSKFRKIPPKAIARAILELDTVAIEQSVLQAMIDQVPTPEEQRAVKKYFEENGEDSTKLDKTENYVLETATVPMMQARLNLMLILLSLDDVVHTVESTTSLIFNATSQLQGSARYKRLMHVILTVGNLLNKGSKKSSAVGFKLSSLPKLMQTKSNSGVSLIDYVVGHLLKQEPDVLEIASEFTGLVEAKQSSFIALSAEVAKLAVGISLGSRIIESTENVEGMGDVCEKIRSGVNKINKVVKRLEALCEEAVLRFNATCVYLGEPISDPGTLFGQLIALLDCVSKSSQDVQAKMKKAAATVTTASLKNIFSPPSST